VAAPLGRGWRRHASLDGGQARTAFPCASNFVTASRLLSLRYRTLSEARFIEWPWSDADRAERLTTHYNEAFNAVRPREYDGSPLTLPGSNPALTLRPHQKAAVWRILQERAVGLFHEVGAGKTTVMAAAAMELRRLGLANKVLMVVPNDILQQFAEEFQRFYPLALLLVPS
jgi:N12 class adenine-specific DNA methylase